MIFHTINLFFILYQSSLQSIPNRFQSFKDTLRHTALEFSKRKRMKEFSKSTGKYFAYSLPHEKSFHEVRLVAHNIANNFPFKSSYQYSHHFTADVITTLTVQFLTSAPSDVKYPLPREFFRTKHTFRILKRNLCTLIFID